MIDDSTRATSESDAPLQHKTRMLLVGDIGQHMVKEPTEPNGTPRQSCDTPNRLGLPQAWLRSDV